jgi:hypothetical protein
LEAGKKRLAGDTARAATSDEVKDLRREASALKEVVAELMLENRLLKKARSGLGRTAHEMWGPVRSFHFPDEEGRIFAHCAGVVASFDRPCRSGGDATKPKASSVSRSAASNVTLSIKHPFASPCFFK